MSGKDIAACGEPEALLAGLKPYDEDPDYLVRDDACIVEWLLAIRHPKPAIRREVVKRLARACGDAEDLVRHDAYTRLLGFPPEDFNEEAKASIRRLLQKENRRIGVIALCGVANMRDQIPLLKKLAARPFTGATAWYTSAGWYAHLALARMGSREDIEYCIKRVESEADVTLRVAKLLHHLGYIRQPEVIPVLQRYLESEEEIPGDDDMLPMKYSRGAAAVLVRILEGFPAGPYGPGSPAEIEVCRKWMREQKEFRFIKGPTEYYLRLSA